MQDLTPSFFLHIFAIVLFLAGCGSEPEPNRTLPPLSPLAAQLLAESDAALIRNDYSRALDLVDQATPLAEDHPRLKFSRGSILLEMRRYQEAETEFREILARYAWYPDAWYRLGASAYRQKQFRRAVEAYRNEINFNPGPQPWHNLGAAYHSLGSLDSARQAYHQAIHLDSLYAPAYASLAELMETEGDVDEALPFAERSAQLSPNDSRHRLVYGVLLLKQNRPLDAIEVLTPLSQSEPWNYGAVYNLGLAYRRLGAEDEAGKLIERAGEIRDGQYRLRRLEEIASVHPDSAEVLVTLGGAYQQAGRTEEALNTYLIAEHYRPTHLGLQLNIATLLMRAGRAQEAVVRYRGILDRDSTFAEAWLNLGSYYASTGQIVEARQAYNRALRYNPDLEPAIRRMARRIEQ